MTPLLLYFKGSDYLNLYTEHLGLEYQRNMNFSIAHGSCRMSKGNTILTEKHGLVFEFKDKISNTCQKISKGWTYCARITFDQNLLNK